MPSEINCSSRSIIIAFRCSGLAYKKQRNALKMQAQSTPMAATRTVSMTYWPKCSNNRQQKEATTATRRHHISHDIVSDVCKAIVTKMKPQTALSPTPRPFFPLYQLCKSLPNPFSCNAIAIWLNDLPILMHI